LQNAVPIVASDGREDPQVSRNTQIKSTRFHPGRRVRTFVRRLLATTLALSALAPAYAALPNVAFAGSSCTGWKSTTVPPDYIRVGRRDGSVDVVPFRKYVGVVSAREWPYWLPGAARRVGAIAVKQYGWYFTMAGNHRLSFVNSRGKCYDVTDGTRDQLYKPEKTTVRRATWRAVDATWSISLRKNANFFLTGYRYGQDVRCGADADGKLLYERSVADCARRGKTTYAILQKYINALTVLDGGTATTALAASTSAGPLAPASDRQAASKDTAATAAPSRSRILFPPSLGLELASGAPIEMSTMATDAAADVPVWILLHNWMGPRVR
jgi:hypothetical protein